MEIENRIKKVNTIVSAAGKITRLREQRDELLAEKQNLDFRFVEDINFTFKPSIYPNLDVGLWIHVNCDLAERKKISDFIIGLMKNKANEKLIKIEKDLEDGLNDLEKIYKNESNI